MKYKIRFKGFCFIKPSRTRWQFCAYPLLGIIRNDIFSGQPCYQLSVDWLLWGVGIIVAFEKEVEE